MEIGKFLVKARKNKGLSQEDVAQTLNVSRQSVSLWECDQTIPSLDNLICLSNLYDVSISILTGQEEFVDTKINNSEEERLRLDAIREEKELASSSKRFFIISFVFLCLGTLFFVIPVLNTFLIIPSIVFSILSIVRKRTNYNLFTLIFSICIFFAGIYTYTNEQAIYELVMSLFNVFK